MSYGTKEYRIEGPQLLKAVWRHHPSGFDVGFATPIEWMPLALESELLPGCFQHTDAFRDDFLPDAVSGDDSDLESFHVRRTLSLLGRQQWRQRSYIRDRIQGLDDSNDFLGLRLWPFGEFRASSEFCDCFVKSHGIGGTALAKIRSAADDSAVFQMNFQLKTSFCRSRHSPLPGPRKN